MFSSVVERALKIIIYCSLCNCVLSRTEALLRATFNFSSKVPSAFISSPLLIFALIYFENCLESFLTAWHKRSHFSMAVCWRRVGQNCHWPWPSQGYQSEQRANTPRTSHLPALTVPLLSLPILPANVAVVASTSLPFANMQSTNCGLWPSTMQFSVFWPVAEYCCYCCWWCCSCCCSWCFCYRYIILYIIYIYNIYNLYIIYI